MANNGPAIRASGDDQCAHPAVRDVLHLVHRAAEHQHGHHRDSAEVHLSNTQAGCIFSAFGYPYLLFQIIGGVTADRFGPGARFL
jgi:hypothetical protein